MPNQFRVLLLSLACSAALTANAQASTPINIPAGELVPALDTLARQSGAQFVYRADQLQGLRTSGVKGAKSPQDAVDRLLQGSAFVAQRDASGAMVIVKRTQPAKPKPRQVSMLTAQAQETPTPEPAPAVQELETVQVTGSRIPRAQIEGPAPISVITAEEIEAQGLVSVPDILRSMTQNGGETQSQQSAGGADFSPGAQQVDLRGLGPNRTLVLINGRRIADFPLPFKGRSNFTDISSIPVGMIERVEVLTGSASAIYGSDAISGVVNFILKKQSDGITVDFRFGQTDEGDAESFKLGASGGYSRGEFNAVFGMEFKDQKPLWGFQRAQQDSTFDGPTANSQLPNRSFLITDYYDDYMDPGEETCDSLSSLNEGSTHYAFRPRYGYYCGSDRAVSYRTMISKRTGINGYSSLSYRFGNGTEWFADIQAGHHEVELFRSPRSWALMTPDGVEHDYFFNQATDQLEYWQRQFSPEEMGGLGAGTVKTTQRTFGVTTGLKGSFADWDYEASVSHSQYKATIKWPQIIAERANNLFLGPLLGYDEDGYPIYNAPYERMYTALTREEYDSIAAYTTYNPESSNQTASFTLTQTSLFGLPGGDAGFAALVELGHQSYDLNPDPLATQYYYYSWKDSDGHGSRNRWALASELRMPVLESLNLSVAGRFDQYRFAGRTVDKPTYSVGLEWRPVESLLVRGSWGTAFRAPDMHYIFAGPGNDETSATDYYRCATEQPELELDDCDYSSEGIIRSRTGSPDLEPETSTSWTAGFVWSPLDSLDFSVDYFDIDMRDQVQDLRVDVIMKNESDCRQGVLDINSATCVDALSRITRTADGTLYGVFVNPINIANESTNGIDASANWRLDTSFGIFRLKGSYTWVREHDIQLYAGDTVDDMFAVNSGYDIPRTKASASVSWERGGWTATLHGQRLGRLPNDDSYYEIYDPDDGGSPWVSATYRYNASVQYRFNDHSRVSLSVTNLFDKKPPYDPTSTGYPYYDVSWFDTEGRSFYLTYTHKFGGTEL